MPGTEYDRWSRFSVDGKLWDTLPPAAARLSLQRGLPLRHTNESRTSARPRQPQLSLSPARLNGPSLEGFANANLPFQWRLAAVYGLALALSLPAAAQTTADGGTTPGQNAPTPGAGTQADNIPMNGEATAAATGKPNSAPPAAEETHTPPGTAAAPPENGAPGNPNRPVNRPQDLPSPAPPPSQLTATRIGYEGQVIVAEGTPEQPVRFVTSSGSITALSLRLDTVARTVSAKGQVKLERETFVEQREMRPSSLPVRRRRKPVTETAEGSDLQFDFKSRQGKLDNAVLRLASFTFSASSLEINGKRYSATNVILRPGGLSEEDRRRYGTPPLSLRARSVVAESGATPEDDKLQVKSAALYFKNTRILPVPSYVVTAGAGGSSRDESAFKVTPRIGYNSADRLLLTTKFRYPLTKNVEKLAAGAEVGYSQRVGFRGGASLDSSSQWGHLRLSARKSDVVTTQLTNRIELDRFPEVNFDSPTFLRFALPGGRQGGMRFNGAFGRYIERTIGGGTEVRSNRAQAGIVLSSRLNPVDGPYVELFANTARYSGFTQGYRNLGYEVGYEGNLLRNVRGQISYRSNDIRGTTPFRFDEVEIAREFRTTFDVQVTPRYIVPIDLRYDLSRNEFRDKTFGLLRSYNNFAYGIVYQSARKDIRLEFREGF